jgi:hypothetical protein
MTLDDLLGNNITAGLCSKSYEIRYSIAEEIESLVFKSFEKDKGDSTAWASQCLQSINRELSESVYPNHRKGALTAIVGLILGSRGQLSAEVLMNALERCTILISDDDPKVRFAACEAIFNIVKSYRGRTLGTFNLIFQGLAKLMGDSDMENRQIAPVLDRMLKEVVLESMESHYYEAIINSVTSTFHLPNIHAKQLCLSWTSLLRSNTGSKFYEKLSSFLTPLFSLICQSISPVLGWRDLAIVAENMLTCMLSEIRVGGHGLLHENALNETVSVLIKYGRFQGSLTSDLSRTILFDWLGVLGSLSHKGDDCVDIILIIVNTYASNPSKRVTDSIIEANRYLLNSPSFIECIVKTSAQNLMTRLEEEALGSPIALEWLKIASLNAKIQNINSLLSLELSPEIIQICTSSFPIELVAKKLLLKARSSPSVAAYIAKAIPTQMGAFLEAVGSFAEAEDSAFVFEIVKETIFGDVWTDRLVDQFLHDPVASLCAPASLLVAIVKSRWSDFETLVDRIGDRDMVLVESLCEELELVVKTRLCLFTQKEFTQGMAKIAMRMNQERPAFTRIFNRLQLVTVYRSFHS